MKITLAVVGKIKEKYFTMAIDEYCKRLGRYVKLEIIEVADEKTPDGASEALQEQIRQKEGERLLKYIRDDAYVIITGDRRKNAGFRRIIGKDRKDRNKRI